MIKKLLFGFLLLPVIGIASEIDISKKIALSVQSNLFEEKTLLVDSLLIKSFDNNLLTSFYRQNQYKTIWLKSNTIRQTLINSLITCEEDGLDPKEYEIKKIDKLEKKVSQLSDNELINFDILLTLKLQKYISQLTNGRLNPRELYKNWDLNPINLDINAQLKSFDNQDSLALKIEKLKPNHIEYKKLKKALQLIKTYPDVTLDCIDFKKKINLNESSPSLISIKKALIYWKDLDSIATLNTKYNHETFVAVKKFQSRNGLNADGVIGKSTIDALNYSKKQRKEQIIANLERWKWFPRNLGNHYIMVNIPEFNLYLVKDNDTIDTRRVVVGKLERKSVVLTSTFSNIIINPTWTVPPTILEEDVLPDATKKRSYFTKSSITIYDFNNKIISPYEWKKEKYKNYRYVQKPGHNNSLGEVKFNFPNRHSVYLHDTNHRDLFTRSFRSLSSGCIRIENPLPLAKYFLNDDVNWSLDKINEVIKTRVTTSIDLKEKINIHQFYWTASLDKNNNFRFIPDVYNLDDELSDKLSN